MTDTVIDTTAAAAPAAPPPGRKLLLGLIGAGITRSLTPALHEEEARQHGIKLHYQLIDVERHVQGAAALPMLVDAGWRVIEHDLYCASEPGLMDAERLLPHPGLL